MVLLLTFVTDHAIAMLQDNECTLYAKQMCVYEMCFCWMESSCFMFGFF